MFESGDFWREIELFAQKQLYMAKFIRKIYFFVKLPEEIEIFRKFAWKNWKFFDPDPRPPDFKPDWRRLGYSLNYILEIYNFI